MTTDSIIMPDEKADEKRVKKSVALINSKAPFSSSNGREALDVALIFGSYEYPISLFFQGDGVWQLISQQDATMISAKDYLKTFAALEFYDIEHIYVCEQSLTQRHIKVNDFHIDNVVVLTPQAMAEKLQQFSTILRF